MTEGRVKDHAIIDDVILSKQMRVRLLNVNVFIEEKVEECLTIFVGR